MTGRGKLRQGTIMIQSAKGRKATTSIWRAEDDVMRRRGLRLYGAHDFVLLCQKGRPGASATVMSRLIISSSKSSSACASRFSSGVIGRDAQKCVSLNLGRPTLGGLCLHRGDACTTNFSCNLLAIHYNRLRSERECSYHRLCLLARIIPC
jgi:hypothetical protein